MGRIRKTLNKKLAVGVSAQLGKQLLPPGVSGNDNERLVGLDFQFTTGRFGLRGEALTGNMPSTPATVDPEFFQAFRPGAHSSAGELLTTYRVAGAHTFYARYNQFQRRSRDRAKHPSVQLRVFSSNRRAFPAQLRLSVQEPPFFRRRGRERQISSDVGNSPEMRNTARLKCSSGKRVTFAGGKNLLNSCDPLRVVQAGLGIGAARHATVLQAWKIE
jgi:hypothetical protein